MSIFRGDAMQPETDHKANAYLQLLGIIYLLSAKQYSSGITSIESDYYLPQESSIFNTFSPYDNANPVYTFVCNFLITLFHNWNISVNDQLTYAEAYRKSTDLSEEQVSLFECAKLNLIALFKGFSPRIAAEFGRQGIPANIKPTWFELEEFLVALYESRKLAIKKPRQKKIFFDTEFTSYSDDNAKLISIGLASEDNNQFYAELTDTYDQSMCSSFVVETVLPLLEGGLCRQTYQELAISLKDWIESKDVQEVLLISDSPSIDFPFIQDLFEKIGWPYNLSKKCEPLHFSVGMHNEKFHQALDNFWKHHAGRQHHALTDAQSYLCAWNSYRELIALS
jgi:hypothetical protein